MKIERNINLLFWLALVLALVGSLRHLASTFASVDGNYLFGVLQAIAIDAGLFALAFSIRQRKQSGRQTRTLWAGLALFTGISIYGNLSFGLVAENGKLPQWLEATRPYVLAGSLPVLVLFLSEILSDNQRFKACKNNHPGTIPEPTPKVAQPAPKKTPTGKAAKINELARLIKEQPEANNTELAAMLNVSRGTIRNYRTQLNGSG